jgi:hypothetical protein
MFARIIQVANGYILELGYSEYGYDANRPYSPTAALDKVYIFANAESLADHINKYGIMPLPAPVKCEHGKEWGDK